MYNSYECVHVHLYYHIYTSCVIVIGLRTLCYPKIYVFDWFGWPNIYYRHTIPMYTDILTNKQNKTGYLY